MKKVILSIVGVLIVIGVVFGGFYISKKNAVVEDTKDTVINSVTFTCADSKNIQAIFFEDKVELNLSDKRNMLLNHAMSASGARYANNDESFVFWNKGNTAFVEEKNVITFKDCVEKSNDEAKPAVTQMGNPASINCQKVGGNIVIQKRGDGGEYGLCYFEENRACEEWALMRGDCPVGGRKTTGYDTIDQNYCAWSGGETYAVKDSVCTFKNGSKCKTIDYYNGTCSPTVSAQ